MEKMENKQKLFELLESFGFIKNENKDFIYFKNNTEILVYPNSDLYLCHYYNTRHHLDWNGWISKKEFNKMFDLD